MHIHHQMEAQAEEQAAEAQKERKLRERNEQYSRQLEEELEGLKVSVQTNIAEQHVHLDLIQRVKDPPSHSSTSLFSTQLKQAGSSAAPASADQTQEVGRLRGDLEKKTLLYEEELARREAQHTTELKALRKELRDAESQHLALQKEILMLKDKLEKNRRERWFICFVFFNFSSSIKGKWFILFCIDGAGGLELLHCVCPIS